VIENIADLLKIARNDCFAESHVLEELRGRAEKASPVRIVDMRRNTDVAGREELHSAGVAHDAREVDAFGVAPCSNLLAHLRV
jgi:hypothetical protein